VQENDKPVLIYSTFPSAEAAESVGVMLVEQRLSACVNIIAGMTSLYRWEGKIARDSEAVMIIKTRKELVDALSPPSKSGIPTDRALSFIEGGSAVHLAVQGGGTAQQQSCHD
jgi:periplasmic divalent cation tolerance protein